MPKFQPVFDPEVPRVEQNEKDLEKHRRWDNPHILHKPILKQQYKNSHNQSNSKNYKKSKAKIVKFQVPQKYGKYFMHYFINFIVNS